MPKIVFKSHEPDQIEILQKILQITNENLSSANSRIRDVDYAKVAAENAKNNIFS